MLCRPSRCPQHSPLGSVAAAAGPPEEKEERKPDTSPQEHRAHAVERDHTAHTVEIQDTSQYERVETDDQQRSNPASDRATPREHPSGHVAESHARVEEQERSIHQVARVASSEHADSRSERHEAKHEGDDSRQSLNSNPPLIHVRHRGFHVGQPRVGTIPADRSKCRHLVLRTGGTTATPRCMPARATPRRASPSSSWRPSRP